MEREWGGSGRVGNSPRGRENEGALKSAWERVRERSWNWKRRRGSHRHLIRHPTQHKVSEVVVVVAVGRMNERQRERRQMVCAARVRFESDWFVWPEIEKKKKIQREREREWRCTFLFSVWVSLIWRGWLLELTDEMGFSYIVGR